jgi:hypothetical protein
MVVCKTATTVPVSLAKYFIIFSALVPDPEAKPLFFS